MSNFPKVYNNLFEHEQALQVAQEDLNTVFNSLKEYAKLQVVLTAQAAKGYNLQAHSRFSGIVTANDLPNAVYRFETTENYGEIKVTVHELYAGNESWVVNFKLSPNIVQGNLEAFNKDLDSQIKGIIGQRKAASTDSIQKQIEAHKKKLASLELQLQNLENTAND